ncbi:MAG: copper amine oxidase N-terminal domain-containing protein [Thermincolia bacterium]
MFVNFLRYHRQNIRFLLVLVTIFVTLFLVIEAGTGLAKESPTAKEESESSGTDSESSTPKDPLKVVVNGKETYSDVPVVLRGGRLFLPVRFIAESLDLPVDWDAATSTIYIGVRPTGVDLVREQPVVNGSKIKTSVKIKGVGYPTGYILSDSSYNNLLWSFNKRNQRITFGFGVMDNSKSGTAGFQVVADDRILGKVTLTKDDGLKDFSYEVKNVNRLVIKSFGGAGGAVINPRAVKIVKK